jgi:hypothetical protein
MMERFPSTESYWKSWYSYHARARGDKLADIGAALNITHERVRQLSKRYFYRVDCAGLSYEEWPAWPWRTCEETRTPEQYRQFRIKQGLSFGWRGKQ